MRRPCMQNDVIEKIITAIRRSGVFLFLSASVILAVWLSSCKSSVSDADIAAIVFPDSNVSYGKQVEPLFLRGCALPSCHDSYTKADGISLETYQDAMDRVGIIVPKHPELSILQKSIDGTDPTNPRMPLNLSPLNSNQIHGIRQWILEGAQNN